MVLILSGISPHKFLVARAGIYPSGFPPQNPVFHHASLNLQKPKRRAQHSSVVPPATHSGNRVSAIISE